MIKQRKDFCKNIKKYKEIIPQTPFEWNYFYGFVFKERSKKHLRWEVLEDLKELSEIKLSIGIPYLKRRVKKHRSRRKCFVCKDNKSYCQHHIILIKNGGYDNGINRIPICKECHEVIHPWLVRV